jgi:hypothetical protein
MDIRYSAATGYEGLYFRSINDANNDFNNIARFDTKTGDVSFYEDTGTTAKLFWDASAESLGIGTTTPDTKIHLVDSTPEISLTRTSDFYYGRLSADGFSAFSNTNSNAPIIFKTATNERMRIDSAGNVGIGTSSVIGNLNLHGGTGDTASQDVVQTFTRISSTGNRLAAKIRLDNYDTSHADLKFQVKNIASSAESDSYYTDAMTIQGTSGNVGIGTSSPQTTLHLLSNTGAVLRFERNDASVGTNDSFGSLEFRQQDASDQGAGIVSKIESINESSFSGAGALAFSTGNATTNTERMRIDSSGNLMVGKTATAYGTAGVVAYANGGFTATKSADAPVGLNRLSSDGSIINFAKDGTTVGSIGSRVTNLYTTYTANGYGLTGTATTNGLIPSLNGGVSNGAVDLGGSAARFKDLHLSGGVYLGGTGAANKLDDYEEGTWTPTLTTSNGGTLGLQYAKGMYTKVGNLVHVSVNIRRDATALSGTEGFLQISTPFTSASSESSHRAGASCVYQNITLNGILVARMFNNTSYFNLQKETNGVLNSSITAADLSNSAPASSSGYVQVAFSYLSV